MNKFLCLAFYLLCIFSSHVVKAAPPPSFPPVLELDPILNLLNLVYTRSLDLSEYPNTYMSSLSSLLERAESTSAIIKFINAHNELAQSLRDAKTALLDADNNKAGIEKAQNNYDKVKSAEIQNEQQLSQLQSSIYKTFCEFDKIANTQLDITKLTNDDKINQAITDLQLKVRNIRSSLEEMDKTVASKIKASKENKHRLKQAALKLIEAKGEEKMLLFIKKLTEALAKLIQDSSNDRLPHSKCEVYLLEQLNTNERKLDFLFKALERSNLNEMMQQVFSLVSSQSISDSDDEQRGDSSCFIQ